MNQTSNYYNQHAQAFFENTYQVEMESLYTPFLRYLPEQALILDLGCGSGRDTLAFKKKLSTMGFGLVLLFCTVKEIA